MFEHLLRRLPIWRRARPTFRGLVLCDDEDRSPELRDVVFEWSRLQPMGSGWWKPHDEHGEPIGADGRTLVLRVKNDTTRVLRVAARLRTRALKRPWDDGTLDLTVGFDDGLRTRLHERIVLSCIGVGGLACVTMAIVSSIRVGTPVFSWPTGQMPVHIMAGLIAVIACFGLGMIGMPVLLLYSAWRPLPNVARCARVTRTAVEVELRDGSRLHRWWLDLDSLCRMHFQNAVLLRFSDGAVVTLLDHRRALYPLLSHINVELLGAESADARSRRYIPWTFCARVSVYCALAGAAAAWYIGTYFPSAAPPHLPLSGAWYTFVSLAVPIPAFCWIAAGLERINFKQFRKRLRSKRRR